MQTVVYGQYIDLPHNIAWAGGDVAAGTATVATVEAGYNYGRQHENNVLGTSIPTIQFPQETQWNAMSVNQKALWIINEERCARGLMPFEDTAQQLITIAQDYTQFLIDNDTTGHRADNKSPEIRLRENPDIDVCMQGFAENIAYVFSTHTTPPTYALERMIYLLIYEDSTSDWGHRKAFFQETYTDDSGEIGKEGLLGAGFVIGENFTYKGMLFNYVAMSTFNMIDPCASWTFPIPPTTNVTQQLFTNIRIFAHRNTLHITGIQDSKITNIQLFDVQGKLHFSCESTQCLLTQRFNSGVYFVSVTHTQGITSQKIVF